MIDILFLLQVILISVICCWKLTMSVLHFPPHLFSCTKLPSIQIRFLSICWNICGIKVRLARSYAHSLDGYQLFQVSLLYRFFFYTSVFKSCCNRLVGGMYSCWKDLLWKRGNCWRDCWLQGKHFFFYKLLLIQNWCFDFFKENFRSWRFVLVT